MHAEPLPRGQPAVTAPKVAESRVQPVPRLEPGSAEGTMASIVCRSIYKYKQDLCTEDEYVVPDTSDCPTDL